MNHLKQIIVAFGLIAGILGAQSKALAHDCDLPSAWHEWTAVGSKNIYLSHLPMFSSIHAYQIIVEVSLSKDSVNRDDIYLQDRRSHPTADYTVSPGETPETRVDYVLPDVVRNRKSFPGYLHRTNSDGTETTIASNLVVSIKRVIYFKMFDGSDQNVKNLTYIIFGDRQELLAAHLMNGHMDSTLQPPAPHDFDQILSIQVSPTPTFRQVPFLLARVDNRPNLPGTRLNNEDVRATLVDGAGPITIKTKDEFHFQDKVSRQN